MDPLHPSGRPTHDHTCDHGRAAGMTPRALRLIRGWTAALVATSAAVLAHVAGGGAWPSLMLFALCVAASAPICMLLAGLKLHALGLTAAVIISQGLFHGLLSLSGGYVAAADHTGHGGHLDQVAHTGPELVLVPSASTDMAGSVHAHVAHAGTAGSGAVGGEVLTSGGLAMLLTHVTAVVVTVLVLRCSEAGALKTMAALLLRAVRWAVSATIPWVTVRPWRPVFAEPLPARGLIRVCGVLSYRGPPLTVALT